MRTTITLDADVAELLRKAMAERGASFKATVNDALRRGLRRAPRAPRRTPSFRMGQPAVPIDKALRLAGAMEDEELTRRLAARK